MKILWKWIIPCCFVMTSVFIACSDDDAPLPPEEEEETPAKKPSEYTLDEHKANITATLNEVANSINTDDFKDVVNIIDAFDNIYSRSNQVDPADIITLRAIRSFSATGNIEAVFSTMTKVAKNAVSRGTEENKMITYTFDKSTEKWIGEYNDSYFTEFHFELEGGKKAEIKFYPEVDYADIEFPPTDEIVIVLDNKELVHLKPTVMDGGGVFYKYSLAICDYNIAAQLYGSETDGEATGALTISKGEMQILSMDATANIDKQNKSEIPFTDINMKSQIMDDFILDISLNITDMVQEIMKSEEDPGVEKLVAILNSHMKGELHYVNDDFTVANITVQAYKKDTPAGDETDTILEEWGFEPIVAFSDGSKFSLDESTSKAFTTIVNQMAQWYNDLIWKDSDSSERD